MTDRKTFQLCQQVFETLSMVLSGDFDDDLLLNLKVVSVDPLGGASHLLVTLQMIEPMPEISMNEIMEKLAEVEPDLRLEVAADIHRKRAPKLNFRVIPNEDHINSV